MATGQRLVVFVPGMSRFGAAGRRWPALRERLEAAGHGDRFEFWDHGVRPWTRGTLGDVAHRLRVQLKTWWLLSQDDPEPVTEIVLMGHSMGGLLVRAAYLLGSEEDEQWTGHVERIVLLAGLNRGLDVRRLGWSPRALRALASVFLRLAANDSLQGSSFVTDLRIRWMRRMRQLGDAAPRVVMLLGALDPLLVREDSLDIEQFPKATHLDVPASTHGDLYDVTGDEAQAAERFELVELALYGDLEPTEPPALDDASRTDPPQVVFLLHGIRAGRDSWPRELKQLLRRQGDVEIVDPSYGYFPAISFALPWTRTKHRRFFQDQYTWALARYPDSGDPHFVGHSNGTYVLGQALAEVPSIRFQRVFLAGSVLPRTYPWRDRHDREQIRELCNDRATADTPVGILCAALRGLGMRDVGTGGVDGFDVVPTGALGTVFPGGHGAALETERLAGVAAYVLDGTRDEPEPSPPRKLFGLISRLTPWLARLVVGGGLALLAWALIFNFSWWLLAAVLGGAFGLYVVLRTF